MREVVTMGVGQTGLKLSQRFFSLLGETMNGKLPSPDMDSGVYFRESASGRLTARGVLVDLQPYMCEIDANIWDPTSLVEGQGGGTGNWARGYYTQGSEYIEIIREALRIKFEQADCVAGVQVFHSLSGGIGGGFGSLILSEIKPDFQKVVFETISVAPNIANGGGHAHGYNVVLTLAKLHESADRILWFDSEVCEDQGIRIGLIPENPTFRQLNQLIAKNVLEMSLQYTGRALKYHGIVNNCMRMSPIKGLNLNLSFSVSMLQSNPWRAYDFLSLWSNSNLESTCLGVKDYGSQSLNNRETVLGSTLITNSMIVFEDLKSIEDCISADRLDLGRLYIPGNHL